MAFLIEAMFTLHWIALAPTRKSYWTGFLFTHKNGSFGKNFVTEPSCAMPILKEDRRHISDRFCATFCCSMNRYSDRSGSE